MVARNVSFRVNDLQSQFVASPQVQLWKYDYFVRKNLDVKQSLLDLFNFLI